MSLNALFAKTRRDVLLGKSVPQPGIQRRLVQRRVRLTTSDNDEAE